jgi:CRISPR-associated protein Cas5h
MILDDGSEEFVKLSEYLLGGKSVFIPYLGKNDHPATIDEVKVVLLDNAIENIPISSLFQEKSATQLSGAPRGELSFYFKETSPHRLQKDHHFYEYENLILTNHKIAEGDFSFIFSHDRKNYAFI